MTKKLTARLDPRYYEIDPSAESPFDQLPRDWRARTPAEAAAWKESERVRKARSQSRALTRAEREEVVG